MHEQEKERDRQYLTFELDGDPYGVDILRVREIITHRHVTPVPRTPAWVLGVINLRGSVVPVLDLALKLDFPARVATASSCIVILEARLEGDLVVLGVLADAVKKVVALGARDTEPVPPMGLHVAPEHVTALGKVDGELITLLDVDRIVSAAEVPQLAPADAPSEPAPLHAMEPGEESASTAPA